MLMLFCGWIPSYLPESQLFWKYEYTNSMFARCEGTEAILPRSRSCLHGQAHVLPVVYIECTPTSTPTTFPHGPHLFTPIPGFEVIASSYEKGSGSSHIFGGSTLFTIEITPQYQMRPYLKRIPFILTSILNIIAE